MIGITLSSEQIRNAPVDVRRWIEREVCASLGLRTALTNAEQQHDEQLAACSGEEVAAILAQIQGLLPAVNVFFEFGRQGPVVGPARVEAFRLLDIAHHTRLPSINQVMSCLDLINEALAQIRGDSRAKFCAFDREGHCFIAQQTQQNILRLWQQVIANHPLAAAGPQDILPQDTLPQDIPMRTMPPSAGQPVGANQPENMGHPASTPVFGETSAISP